MQYSGDWKDPKLKLGDNSYWGHLQMVAMFVQH